MKVKDLRIKKEDIDAMSPSLQYVIGVDMMLGYSWEGVLPEYMKMIRINIFAKEDEEILQRIKENNK